MGIQKSDLRDSVGRREYWLVAATLQCHTRRKKSKRVERQVATPVWLRLLIRGWNQIQLKEKQCNIPYWFFVPLTELSAY